MIGEEWLPHPRCKEGCRLLFIVEVFDFKQHPLTFSSHSVCDMCYFRRRSLWGSINERSATRAATRSPNSSTSSRVSGGAGSKGR